MIDHFNNSFSNTVSNDEFYSVDEHKVKFKGLSSMKQYVKKKTIKWGFKFYYDRLLAPARILFREER